MDDFLKMELRLLQLRYGRRRILESFGALTEQTPDQIEAEIAALEARKTKRVRKVRSVDDVLAELVVARPEAAQILRTLATRYENRSFLPQLKDVQRFLERLGLARKSLKSRRDALKHVLTALSRLSADELDRLARLSANEGDSDYANLAREIMGRRS
jgi:hypothetical protein